MLLTRFISSPHSHVDAKVSRLAVADIPVQEIYYARQKPKKKHICSDLVEWKKGGLSWWISFEPFLPAHALKRLFGLLSFYWLLCDYLNNNISSNNLDKYLPKKMRHSDQSSGKLNRLSSSGLFCCVTNLLFSLLLNIINMVGPQWGNL